MKNDKGFTLVELIVCMAIFAIVVAAVFGFMLAASRSYSTVTNRIDLQLQSELAANQLGEYIMECNSGLAFKHETNTLYVINKDENGSTYTAHVFQLKADNCIYYKKGTAQLVDDEFTCAFPATATDDLLAENVTYFSVTPISSDGANVTSAVISISLARGSASSSDKKTVALRNKPAISIVQSS